MEARAVQSAQPQAIPKPLANLLHSVLSLMTHSTNPINALTEIVKQPKDRDGNIFIGIDNPDFDLWRGKLEKFVPKKIFGPILIPTNPQVIVALLADLKAGSRFFAGNRSTDVIQSLTGQENIFSPYNPQIHALHKDLFKTFIANVQPNVEKCSPVILNWITIHFRMGKPIDDQAVELLAAQIMLTFLLNRAAGFNRDLVNAIIKVKTYFVKNATLKEMDLTGFLNGYNSAKQLLIREIEHLYNSEDASYPRELKSKNLSLPHSISHILSLMMVGFDNLQSMLMSLLIRLTEHPEYRDRLKKEIIQVGGVDFLHFDIGNAGLNDRKSFSQQFFLEALRLTPPVWLQARKNKNEDREIRYQNSAGERSSFLLPSATLVLIPNYQLARKLENGNDFLPDRELKHALSNPFSVGPNACPGRNIGYAAAGVLMPVFAKSDLVFSLAKKPRFDPQVSLLWKNLQIQSHQGGEFKHHIVTPKQDQHSVNAKLSLTFGVLIAFIAYSREQNPLSAIRAGCVAGLLMLFLLMTNKKKVTFSPEFFQQKALSKMNLRSLGHDGAAKRLR